MALPKISMLLIENDSHDAQVIKAILAKPRNQEFSVLHVETLNEGLTQLQTGSFDVVMIDLALPDCQGLETALAVQDRARAPVIVVASIDDEEVASQFLEKGIQDYLLREEINSRLLLRSINYAIQQKRSLDELQKSEERFRTTYNKAAVGMGKIAVDGRMLWVNQKLCNILGYTKEEITNLTIEDITHPDDLEITNQYFQRLLHGEIQDYTLEKRNIHKDGSTYWVRVSASMVSETGGSYVIGFVEDISGRKLAEDALRFSEARFQALFRDNPVMIITIDNDLTMLSVNPITASNLGYSVDELEGESILQLFHEEDRTAVADQLRKCLENPYHVYTWQFRKINKGGDLVWVEEFAQAVYDLHGALNVLVVCQDITERKRAEDALQEALYELERSNKDLEQFASLASHDLQEPLRMVSAYMKLLEKKYHDKLDEKAAMYIHFAVDGANRMHNLIEGLMTYSRIGRGKSFGRVDSNRTFADATANLMTSIRETNAEVVSTPLPIVWGDATMLLQLFQNLLSNSIKYRKQGVPPRILISAERLEREWLFSVQDNGIGIESGNFDRVFQIFQRLHTAEEFPGTGIGLASCKRIVEQHHGRIWLESTPGEGTTFFFTIPVNGESSPEEGRIPA